MSRGVLFVHSNFPSQFADVARALVEAGEPCAAIGGMSAPGVEGVTLARWANERGSTPNLFPLAVRAEADLIRAHAAWMAARSLRQQGFVPDLIIGHPGWGETVLLDEVFPQARQIIFGEFFYHGRGADIDFDTEFIKPDMRAILNGKAKNATMALAYSDADAIVSPTPFQASMLPEAFRARARIIHEGVDVEAIRPAIAEGPILLPDGTAIRSDAPLITHVNRHMEPMRGLHILLRALPALQAAAPNAHVVLIGSQDKRGYSGPAPDDKTWAQVILEGLEGRIDLSRVHFTGRLEHSQMIALLQRSWAHVYYTYPFVLSWSLAEAMAAGCYVIGSDTPPVRDAIVEGVNGRLLPFFDVGALADALIEACRAGPRAFPAMRAAARETAVTQFSRAEGRRRWLELIAEVRNRPR